MKSPLALGIAAAHGAARLVACCALELARPLAGFVHLLQAALFVLKDLARPQRTISMHPRVAL